LGDLTLDVHVELDRARAGERGEDPTEVLHESDAGTNLLGHVATVDIDRVGDEVTGEREADRAGDSPTGLLLRLVGGRPEVRRDDDGLELEERARGRRLLGEDVEACTGDSTLADRVG